jgi:hypothetical protein
MSKRFLFVFCAFYVQTPSLSIPYFVIVTTINVLFVLNFRPFENEVNNHFEVFNELITIYFLITLSGITGDFSVNKPFEVIVTWVALSILLLYLVVHMIY